jgi:hypothetical protein
VKKTICSNHWDEEYRSNKFQVFVIALARTTKGYPGNECSSSNTATDYSMLNKPTDECNSTCGTQATNNSLCVCVCAEYWICANGFYNRFKQAKKLWGSTYNYLPFSRGKGRNILRHPSDFPQKLIRLQVKSSISWLAKPCFI